MAELTHGAILDGPPADDKLSRCHPNGGPALAK
jgi:hypothetical protein